MVFPVKFPYAVAADIVKYNGPIFNSQPDQHYLAQKKIELQAMGDTLLGTVDGAMPLVKRMAAFCGMDDVNNIRSIALQLEEDIAILHKGKLMAICFCFPSGFVPATKMGLSFFDLHLPVADGDNLRGASEKVAAIVSRTGAVFRRHVWTVSALPGLSQHPTYERPHPTTIDDLFFRTETQTTVGGEDDCCFFFVKVDMHPLGIVWEDKAKRNLLQDSINSMTDATLAYKNLHQIKKIINASR